MAGECLEDLDPFNCPICLDALQDPVTIPCGHNYCMNCIKDYWDKNAGKDVDYSCPQCRKTFSPRPVLNKNTMFAEVVERFKNTGLQDSPPKHYDGHKHTERDTCENSCCKTHLRYRNNDYPREKHTVIVVTGEPRESTCSQHNTLSGVYSQTDRQIISPPCLDEAHRRLEAFAVAPEKMKTLERRTTLVKREHRIENKTTRHDRRQSRKRVQGTGHRHGHRSGRTHGSHAKRRHETHWRHSSGHRGHSHGHSHGAGHRKRRLGIMVMTGTGTHRTTVHN